MPSVSNARNQSVNPPSLESLEPRVLLTTVHAGDSFIYHTSKGDIVRVTLNGDPADVVELLAFDGDPRVALTDPDAYSYDVINVPGLMNELGQGWVEQDWDIGSMGDGEPIVKTEDGVRTFIEMDTGSGIHGSRVEIYAVYFAHSSVNTILTFATLAGDIDSGDDWDIIISPWSKSPPNIGVNEDGDAISAPGGTGGVIIGAVWSPVGGDDPIPDRYLAVGTAAAGVLDEVRNFSPLGVFPGGRLRPGITVSEAGFEVAMGDLGGNVQSIAVHSDGTIFLTDSSGMKAVLLNGTSLQTLGRGIRALAANDAGMFFAVDSTPDEVIAPPSSPAIGTMVQALAADGAGNLYAIDEGTSNLVLIVPGQDPTIVGEVHDSAEGGFGFTNVRGLDFDPVGGSLFGIADLADLDTETDPGLPDPVGPFLVQFGLTAEDGVVTATRISPMAMGVSSIAFSATGTLYGLDPANNQLVTIDPTTGAVTPGPTLLDGAVVLTGVLGIEFIGDQLYGVTADSLYIIDVATGTSVLVRTSTSVDDMPALAYDASLPGYLYTVTDNGGGFRLAAIPLGAVMNTADTEGVVTPGKTLVGAADPLVVYQNVTAMDVRADGTIYGIAERAELDPYTTAPDTKYLVTINGTTGLVTELAAISNAVELSSIAFNAADQLFGLDPTTDTLYQIDPATGAATGGAVVTVTGLTGLEFVTVGGNEILYGVTNTTLYKVNPATGQATELADTGRTDLGSLAIVRDSTQANVLWTASDDNGNGFRLTRIDLSATLITAEPALNGTITVTRVARIIDSLEPSFAYTNIHGMAFDSANVLYAIGTIVNMNPVDVADPVSFGPYLLTIDPTTGVATQVGALQGVADLTAIAVDANGVMYGVNPDTDELVTVDTATGVCTVVAPLRNASTNQPITGVTGLGFAAGVLYAISDDSLYTVDPATGRCSFLANEQATGFAGLSGDPTSPAVAGDPLVLWSTVPSNGQYRLAQVLADPEFAKRNVGRIIVDGVVAGSVNSGGSIDLIEMGFLWGNVSIARNMDNMIIRQGGGAVPLGDGYLQPSKPVFQDPVTLFFDPLTDVVFSSLVHVGGAVTMLNSMANVMYSAVQVGSDPAIPWQNVVANLMDPSVPAYQLDELETRVDADFFNTSWIAGMLVDYVTDTVDTAQFLSHPSGTYQVFGTLNGGGDNDWYAIPLMAGQTITVSGDMGGWGAIQLLDWRGIYLDSYRYESLDDWGIDSRPGPSYVVSPQGVPSGYKPITFTAEEGGIYYLHVSSWYAEDFDGGSSYFMYVSGGPTAALGAVSVGGEMNAVLYTGEGRAELSHISVENGGGLGAVFVVGNSIGNGLNASAYSMGGGDLVAYVAGIIGGPVDDGYTLDVIKSDSNIGQVRSRTSWISADITAGASGGFYNDEAYIQNIYSAERYRDGSIVATGNIGMIETVGNMAAILISVNDDGIGLPGHLDLIDVGGQWRSTVLQHGTDGNIGFVHVRGTIFVWGSAVIESTFSDGRAVVLNDDGGGRMTVTVPERAMIVDAFGRPVLDTNGQPTFAPTTTVSYSQIPVDDMVGGIGGVIANLRFDGPATLTATGRVEVSNLALTGPAATSTLTINGTTTSSTVPVYYLTAPGLLSFTNNTPGNLISALFTGTVDTIKLAGSVGPEIGSTYERLRGRDVAVGVGLPTAPRFGWSHGTLNGIDVVGDLNTLTIDGALSDLRVSGTAGTIRVNADNRTPAYRANGAPGGDGNPGWDGVRGIVFAGTRINQIFVGDGLADDGGSVGMDHGTVDPPVTGGTDSYPRAAIMSAGSIGTVTIVGPRREFNGMVFGELNGSIMAMQDALITVTSPMGVTTQVVVPAIGSIIGTQGASLTAIVGATQLDSWRAGKGSEYFFTGGVGTVDFSGDMAETGATINGSEIYGQYINKVIASLDSNGIANSIIDARSGRANLPAIGQVLAGGPGMNNVLVVSSGGDIGEVRGLGPVADIKNSSFVSTAGMQKLIARDLVNNGIHMPGTVKWIESTRDMRDNLAGAGGGYGVQATMVGAIDKIVVGNDFARNQLTVAGTIGSMVVKGDFENSVVTLQGPAIGYLKSLLVTGNISGQIVSAGRIGTIISQKGAISANIKTLENDSNSDVDKIQTALGFTGRLDVAGTLHKFISAVSLGSNPDTNNGQTQQFNIGGNLDSLRVGSKGVANLYTDINVGGNIGVIDVDGTMYSRISTNGDLSKLLLDGALGGMLNMGPRGSVMVFGDLGQLTFAKNSDMVADLDIGGDIQAISLKGGSVLGQITSRHGLIKGVTVVGGNIAGDITGDSIGAIAVTGGNITANVTANKGGIKSLTVKADKFGGGSLLGDVTANGGRIDVLSLAGGDAGTGHTIYASGGFKTVSITRGDLNANLMSGMDITTLTVKGGDIAGRVSADRIIGAVNGDGTISGTVRAGAGLGKLSAGALSNALISSGWNIGAVNVKNSVVNSKVLAGFDVGADGVLGDIDDNALNGGRVHSGNIASMTVGGVLDRSIVAAGIDGGADFLNLTDDVEADGVSSILKLQVKGGFGADATKTAVLADTSIDPKFAPAGVIRHAGVTRIEAGVGTQFGNSIGLKTLTTGTGLVLTLTGDGTAWFNEGAPGDNGKLVLKGTSIRSALTILYTGAGNYKTIDIVSDDDSALSGMKVGSNVTIGDVSVDGMVNALDVARVASGSTWLLPGGIKTAKTGALDTADITAGTVGSWTMSGAMTGGALTVDSITSFTTPNGVGGNLTSKIGGATTVKIGGNLTGQVNSFQTIKSLMVGASIADGAKVTVSHGDLTSLKVGSNLVGSVDVSRGAVGSVGIATGNFGGSDTTAFRAGAGIGSFIVSKGNFSGILSTDGNLGTVSASKGAMTGRVRSGGTIKSASFGSMDSARLSAAHELVSVKVAENMDGTFVFAGFDPGDGGYDATNGGETVNLEIDAFSDPDDLSLVPVDDVVMGGDIGTVTIGGDMRASTISAGVGPGRDGVVGSNDDVVAGTGTVGKVTVKRGIIGAAISTQTVGVYAVSKLPVVTSYGQPFDQNGNAYVKSMHDMAGTFEVTGVAMPFRSFEVTFNHAVNFGTINTAQMDPSRPTTFSLFVSVDDVFGNGDDVNVSDLVPNVVSYDADTRTVTLTLVGKTWETLDLGTYFQLVIDGDDSDGLAVTDMRSNVLDGENFGVMPSGDGLAGGTFSYIMLYGPAILTSFVPYYGEQGGSAPTAAGMLVGYYDLQDAYGNLIEGDASMMTAEVMAAIASPGHNADYASYGGVYDWIDILPTPDMSEIDPTGAHVDNCLADFMRTSRSVDGMLYGETLPQNIAPGIEAYFAYRGYSATAEYVPWGEFTWASLVTEINAGRPVLLNVDAGMDGVGDTIITAIGYDMTTHQYAVGTGDPLLPYTWYDFQSVSYNQVYGIAAAVTVHVA